MYYYFFHVTHQSSLNGGLFMHQTPVNMLAQLLYIVDRAKFKMIAAKHQVEKSAKGFTAWTHFICMIFVHLAQVSSLRDVSNGLTGLKGKLNHLGINSPPTKSTLSYANSKRTSEFFEAMYLKISNTTTNGARKNFTLKTLSIQ
jgi:hypothetical protein